VDGIGEGAWDVGRVGDQEVVLGDWHGDAADVSFLEGIGADEVAGVIATRETECICAPRRGHENGDAGAGGGHTDADLASVLHVSRGGMAVGLFVPDKNVSDVGRFEQRARISAEWIPRCRTRSRYRVLRASAPLTELRCHLPGRVG
jgi:hypothetical protein